MKNTIKDVAKQANVSIATVSRVLNNVGGYSEETKNRVLRIIDEIGYQPNAVARGLIKKRTQTIGVLVPDISSMLSSEILSGVESVAHKENSSVIICRTEANGIRTMRYLQLLNEKRIDGIIFVSEYLTAEYYNEVKKMNIPIVLVSTECFEHKIPYVKVDDRQAAFRATEYLIENGHKQISMISGPKADPIAGRPRIEGFLEALRHYSIYENYRIELADGFSFLDGVNAFHKLIKRDPAVSAIFAASDEMAVGAISAAYNMGLNVPKDISIIGYDNTKVSEMCIPPLTTVSQPLFQMGEVACEMLFQILEHNDSAESWIMPHNIVERSTVKKI